MVGQKDARIGAVVAPCSRFVARTGGPLLVGVNDTDPGNNEGHVRFGIRARGPTPEEWTSQETASDCASPW
jgi:hypothetical protein